MAAYTVDSVEKIEPGDANIEIPQEEKRPSQISQMSEEGKSPFLRRCQSQVDEHGHEKEPLKYIVLIGDHPLKMFSLFCGCWFFMLLLVIATAGELYVSMTNFPFYVKGNIRYEKEQSVKKAKLDADAIYPLAGSSTSNTPLTYKEREYNLYTLKIIYEGDGVDMWSLPQLQTVAEIERFIIGATGKNSNK
jgi:hypothetical protein